MIGFPQIPPAALDPEIRVLDDWLQERGHPVRPVERVAAHEGLPVICDILRRHRVQTRLVAEHIGSSRLAVLVVYPAVRRCANVPAQLERNGAAFYWHARPQTALNIHRAVQARLDKAAAIWAGPQPLSGWQERAAQRLMVNALVDLLSLARRAAEMTFPPVGQWARATKDPEELKAALHRDYPQQGAAFRGYRQARKVASVAALVEERRLQARDLVAAGRGR